MSGDHAGIDAVGFRDLQIADANRGDKSGVDLVPGEPAVGAAHAAGVEAVDDGAAGSADHVVDAGPLGLGAGDREQGDGPEEAHAGDEDGEEDFDNGDRGAAPATAQSSGFKV